MANQTEKGQEKVTRMDILCMLLLAEGPSGKENEPVVGKTRLQKELFLSQKALKDLEFRGKYAFRPYHYGPYCKEVYKDLDLLESRGRVKQKPVFSPLRGAIQKFQLTPAGVQYIKDIIRELGLEEYFDIVRKVKEEYNGMDVVDLVELTHKLWPEYKGFVD